MVNGSTTYAYQPHPCMVTVAPPNSRSHQCRSRGGSAVRIDREEATKKFHEVSNGVVGYGQFCCRAHRAWVGETVVVHSKENDTHAIHVARRRRRLSGRHTADQRSRSARPSRIDRTGSPTPTRTTSGELPDKATSVPLRKADPAHHWEPHLLRMSAPDPRAVLS